MATIKIDLIQKAYHKARASKMVMLEDTRAWAAVSLRE